MSSGADVSVCMVNSVIYEGLFKNFSFLLKRSNILINKSEQDIVPYGTKNN